MIAKNGSERRRHKRHELKDQVFITFRPQFEQIGWLMDISKGGVSFKYSAIHNNSTLPEVVHVDIFCSQRKYRLSNLPCKIIYEDTIDKVQVYMDSIETRRCGLVFGEMTQQQAAHLDDALCLYT